MILLTGNRVLKCFLSEPLTESDKKIDFFSSSVRVRGLEPVCFLGRLGNTDDTEETEISAEGTDDEPQSIKHISLFNSDSIPHTLTVQVRDNHGDSITLHKTILPPGTTLHYTDMRGFYILYSNTAPTLGSGQFYEGGDGGTARIVNSNAYQFLAPGEFPLDYFNIVVKSSAIEGVFSLPSPEKCKNYFIHVPSGAISRLQVIDGLGTVNELSSDLIKDGRTYWCFVNEEKTGYYLIEINRA